MNRVAASMHCVDVLDVQYAHLVRLCPKGAVSVRSSWKDSRPRTNEEIYMFY